MSIFLPRRERGRNDRGYQPLTMEEPIVMKKIIALAVIGIASQTMTAFAGPPETKQVIAPPPPPPPSYFRPNEFDIGAFATWAPFTGINSAGNGNASVRLGRRHGFHLLISLKICRCRVLGNRNEYPIKWFYHNGTTFYQLACQDHQCSQQERVFLWGTPFCDSHWMISGHNFTWRPTCLAGSAVF